MDSEKKRGLGESRNGSRIRSDRGGSEVSERLMRKLEESLERVETKVREERSRKNTQ